MRPRGRRRRQPSLDNPTLNPRIGKKKYGSQSGRTGQSAGQFRERHAGRVDLGVAVRVGIPHDRVGVRDVEIVSDQCHDKGRIEMIEEGVGRAITIAVTQKRDAVAWPRIATRCRPFFQPSPSQCPRAERSVVPEALWIPPPAHRP